MDILINLAGIMGHDSQEGYTYSVLKELLPKLSGKKVMIVAPDYFPLDGLSLDGVAVQTYRGLDTKARSVLFVQAYLPFLILRKKVTIVYSPTVIFPFACARRCIPTIHDLAYALYPEDAGRLARQYIKLLYRTALKKCKTVFTVSETMKGELSAYGNRNPDTITVAYGSWIMTNSSTDTSKCELPEQSYFLYLGMYKARKNIEYILRGFKQASVASSHTLVLAGSVKAQKAQLTSLALELGIADRVHFLGYVPEACKRALYEHSAGVLFPSLYEGFGLPVLEAQEWNTPVVVSDIPVMREVAGTGAAFVDPHAPASLASAMDRVVTDTNFRSMLVEEGKKNAARFSFEKTASIIAWTLK